MKICGRRKRFFSLIEVLVGVSLLASFSGVVGWKMAPLMREKTFKSDMARLKLACQTLQRLAQNTQSDWNLVIKRDGTQWLVQESSSKGIKAPFHVKPLYMIDVMIDGKRVDELKIEFFASGKVLPEGTLSIEHQQDSNREEWVLAEMFHQETGHEVPFIIADRSPSSGSGT